MDKLTKFLSNNNNWKILNVQKRQSIFYMSYPWIVDVFLHTSKPELIFGSYAVINRDKNVINIKAKTEHEADEILDKIVSSLEKE